ncbi:phytanoyl-CoA dioxygenase [Niabella ginsenosidivorans]|uniref:Phytanoyl-CoA dioxygenase n=1 Tax=Niabella ginsenosidivorans TaxID=1176587 RepID=A0A1A9HYQ2_9BACT|nr:phytanoyl-CoA dioxygenase family protein [Niabella ginsenosidivorans]ANH80537.1 phytanoyl-CoA dioxygenase [Niabella ginsenosidivorans]
MNHPDQVQSAINTNGFAIIPDIYTPGVIDTLIAAISNTDTHHNTFRRSKDLFAIRQFLKEIPEVLPLIFNERLKAVINEVFGSIYFVTKSIYFDKPETSNWYVAYHQDLTISVDKKINTDGYSLWTVKQGQYAVQPPVEILENNFTIRIHLDDTDEYNGALKVIPGSHKSGILSPDRFNKHREQPTICKVPRGGIMIMKPLLLHRSGRTVNKKRRRVIHIEFSDAGLSGGLHWSEQLIL